MISVIVPVYNVGSFLEDCVDSIINQTYTQIEIILVNDGSTDESGAICDKYLSIDKRIQVLHQENQGLSVARNNGVSVSCGEYIVFVDSDDMIHPQMIELLYESMKKSEADLAICTHTVIEENEVPQYTIYPSNMLFTMYTGKQCLDLIFTSKAVDMVVAWNKLYKRDEVIDYPVGRVHEDEFTTYKILNKVGKCVYLECPLYFYRVRNTSITQSGFSNKSLDKIDAYEERTHYFKVLEDQILYEKSLRQLETLLAESILKLEMYSPTSKETIAILMQKYINYWEMQIKKSEIALIHKLKYWLFLKNRKIYKLCKKIK